MKAEQDFYREKWQKRIEREKVTSHHFERLTHNIVRVSSAAYAWRNVLSELQQGGVDPNKTSRRPSKMTTPCVWFTISLAACRRVRRYLSTCSAPGALPVTAQSREREISQRHRMGCIRSFCILNHKPKVPKSTTPKHMCL